MKLNEQIREYRKKAGLTQEQVANYLGVSAPAVNKWESGVSCPDITLLAPIARLLQIDLNTLFTFHENLSREDVALLCNEIQSQAEANGFLAGFSAATARLREYPNCDLLRFSLSLLMEGHLNLAALEPEAHRKYEKQLMAWYDQAANGQDAETRDAAVGILVNKSLSCGNIEKAQKLLARLPEKRAVDQQMLQINILFAQEKYEEAAILAERKIFSDIAALQSYFTKLVDIDLALQERDAAACAAEASQKLAEIFGVWDYSAYVCPLQLALAAKDISKSTKLIEAMLRSVLLPVTMPGLFRHLPTKPVADDFGSRMLSMLLHQFETDKDYDFLRADLDFQNLLAEYKTDRCHTAPSKGPDA